MPGWHVPERYRRDSGGKLRPLRRWKLLPRRQHPPHPVSRGHLPGHRGRDQPVLLLRLPLWPVLSDHVHCPDQLRARNVSRHPIGHPVIGLSCLPCWPVLSVRHDHSNQLPDRHVPWHVWGRGQVLVHGLSDRQLLSGRQRQPDQLYCGNLSERARGGGALGLSCLPGRGLLFAGHHFACQLPWWHVSCNNRSLPEKRLCGLSSCQLLPDSDHDPYQVRAWKLQEHHRRRVPVRLYSVPEREFLPYWVYHPH